MKLPRRTFLHLAAGAASLPAVSRIARAQTYPARPVRIIVGFSAGGPSDIVARIIARWLSEHLGQEFVVENRPGAAGNIGTEAALRAPPDGYTLLLVTSTNAVNVTFYENLNFNFMSDIAPVAGIIRVPFVMEINPSIPAKTVPEFIAYAKANPGKINMASGGIGTSVHIAGRPRSVLDYELLPEMLRQPLSDDARNNVGRPPSGKPDDDAHRPRRIGLRPSEARDSGQCRSAHG